MLLVWIESYVLPFIFFILWRDFISLCVGFINLKINLFLKGGLSKEQQKII